jgi:RNA polymerase primary sigma factor
VIAQPTELQEPMMSVATAAPFAADADAREDVAGEGALTRYLDEVGRHPLLSPAEELGLARRARSGDARAKRRLVECNLRLVVSLARRYRGLGLDLLDLIQEGNVGLLAAADSYDPSREVRFASYASSCVRREICRALSTRSRLVRLPARLADASTRVKGADRRLAQQLGRRPSAAEVAEAAGVTERMVEDLRRSEHAPVSLSEPIGDREVTLQDVLADDPSSDPARIVVSSEDGAIEAALSRLAPRARQVIELRFGLGGREPATLAGVAATMGLSPARVRQLEVRSLLELSRSRDLRDLQEVA